MALNGVMGCICIISGLKNALSSGNSRSNASIIFLGTLGDCSIKRSYSVLIFSIIFVPFNVLSESGSVSSRRIVLETLPYCTDATR